MKFTHFLLKSMVPEWIKLYLNFKLLKTYLSISTCLKTLLVLAKKTKSVTEYKQIKASIMDHNVLMDKLEYDNQQFIEAFKDEVEKVETFVIWKYSDLKQKMNKLQVQIRSMRKAKEDLEHLYDQWKHHKGVRRNQGSIYDFEAPDIPLIDYDKIENDYDDFQTNKKELLETFYRFYNESVHFQSYVEVNSEGIRKILKKYKKQMIKGIRKKKNERQYFGNILEKMQINNISNKIKTLLFDIEQIMIQNFYPNKPKLCRDSLRKYSQNTPIKLRTLFAFGFFAGFAFVFVLIIGFMRYEGYLDPTEDRAIFGQVFPSFRGMGLFLIYYWFLALDVWGWNYFRINYKIYLGFNHHFSTLTEILSRVSILSAVYLVIFVIYCLQASNKGKLTRDLELFDPIYLPLILWVIVSAYVIMPTKRVLNGEGRGWMFKMIAGSIFGHFIKYESRYTFFTDQFVSLVIPFTDLDYTVCFYYELIWNGTPKPDLQQQCILSNRFAAMIAGFVPYLLMCIQYISRARDKGQFFNTLEMWNFMKHFVSMQLALISYLAKSYSDLQYVWVTLAIIISLFTYYWDVRQDWLLFEPGARYKFLRNDLGYNNPAIYYVLATLNFFLRGIWIFSICPDILVVFNVRNVELLLLLFGFVELLRRLIFNFLKIEKEHITNQNQFKTVMDYKYPFDSNKAIRLNEDDNMERHTHWSVSTLNQMSEIEILSRWGAYDDNKSNIQNISQARNNDVSGDTEKSQMDIQNQFVIQLKDEKPQKTTSSLYEGGIQAHPSEEQQSPKKEKEEDVRQSIKNDSNSVPSQFRLTQIIKKDSTESNKLKRKDTLDIAAQNVNLDILNKAKLQEKLQMHKTHHIQEDNKKYKEIINQFYQRYNITQN